MCAITFLSMMLYILEKNCIQLCEIWSEVGVLTLHVLASPQLAVQLSSARYRHNLTITLRCIKTSTFTPLL